MILNQQQWSNDPEERKLELINFAASLDIELKNMLHGLEFEGSYFENCVETSMALALQE